MAKGFGDSRRNVKLARHVTKSNGNTDNETTPGVYTPESFRGPDWLPVFHFVELFQWLLSKQVILQSSLRVMLEQYDIFFSIGLRKEVVSYLQNAVVRIINKNEPGTIVRAFGQGEKWIERVQKAVLQDLFRPIFWKLTHPEEGSLEYERTYRGVPHTRGARLLADLILEAWSIFDIPRFGNLRVVIKPSKADYDAAASAFPYLRELEKLNPPYSDGSLDVVFSTLSTRVNNFDVSNYSWRSTAKRLPCIGDLFFYTYAAVEYVYTLADSRVNLLSMSLNFFLGTKLTDSTGTPIGHEIVERVTTITVNPDGTRTESTTTNVVNQSLLGSRQIDGSTVRRIYEWDSSYNLSLLLDPLPYIYLGNVELHPTVNLGFKGIPGTESQGPSPGGRPSPGTGGGGPLPSGPSQPPSTEIQEMEFTNVPSSPGGAGSLASPGFNFGVSIPGFTPEIRAYLRNTYSLVTEASRLNSEAQASGNEEQSRQARAMIDSVRNQANAMDRLLEFTIATGPPPLKAAAGALKVGRLVGSYIRENFFDNRNLPRRQLQG